MPSLKLLNLPLMIFLLYSQSSKSSDMLRQDATSSDIKAVKKISARKLTTKETVNSHHQIPLSDTGSGNLSDSDEFTAKTSESE